MNQVFFHIIWMAVCVYLGPGVYADFTLTHATYLNIVTDQIRPFMAMVFPNCSGLFQQDDAP